MKTEKNKIILLSLAFAIMLMSFISIGYLILNNNRLQGEKETAIIQTDSALSVKLLVDKSYGEAKDALSKLEINHKLAQKKLNDALAELDKKQVELEKMQMDVAATNGLRKQIAALKKSIGEYEVQLLGLSRDRENLLADLEVISKSKQGLLNENEMLRAKLEAGKKLQAHNIKTQAFKVKKGKAKPTLRARRTNRISVDFDIAENMVADAGNRNILLVITKPDGTVLNSPLNKFIKKETGEQATYSAKKEIMFKNYEQSISLSYDLEKKAAKGKYKIEIFDDGVSGGKSEFALR